MSEHETPWFQRTLRWGQTNLTELDPQRYDAAWWRQYWKETALQGVIVNAGGIVAYYPSRFDLHRRAEHLGERDLYGEIVRDAREEGLAVLARMDSNRADDAFFRAHPDWFTVDADGTPYRAGDKYISCVNSAYYSEFLPEVLREIIERSSPDGFADNSWAGLHRSHICYCENCARAFRATAGLDLPVAQDWDDVAYQQWIRWNYERRTEIWDQNNAVTRSAGGEHCLWLGMLSGDMDNQAGRCIDAHAILERASIVLLDHQRRNARDGFAQNAEAGKRLHGMLGWDKLIPESTAMYGMGLPSFRLSRMPPAEARIWAAEGFAGGIQPWWHHIGSYHEDRRQYRTAKPLFQWHRDHEQYLVDRSPVAAVGVVWSQLNNDYYGRHDTENRALLPYRGAVRALTRARIPYVPVHVDDISRAADGLAVLVLPNTAALTDDQVRAVSDFAAGGGAVIATGETSLYSETGERRDDFALADLLGVHTAGRSHGSDLPPEFSLEDWSRHTYLRLLPELRASVEGPSGGGEPPATGTRHPVLEGFGETDVVPFGGRLEEVVADGSSEVPLTLVPAFPIYPPETSWMRQPSSDIPALVLRTSPTGARTAYLAADLDRCAGRDDQPDHVSLLANLVRWATGGNDVLEVEGPGVVDCNLYAQGERRILHLGNVGSTSSIPGRLEEQVPVGPFEVRVRAQSTGDGAPVRLLVSGQEVQGTHEGDWVRFTVPRVHEHEVAVIG